MSEIRFIRKIFLLAIITLFILFTYSLINFLFYFEIIYFIYALLFLLITSGFVFFANKDFEEHKKLDEEEKKNDEK